MQQYAIDYSLGISPFKNKPFGGISSSALKMFALTLMLLDHSWATIIPGNNWMTYMGRLAFPIFAFQLVEGFLHTSDLRRYGKRLLLFAVLTEIPFNFMLGASFLYPFHQNVMFTMLIGLGALKGLDQARRQRTWIAYLKGAAILLLCYLLASITFVDYGGLGILTIAAFYIFRGLPFAWVGQLAAMVLLHIVTYEGWTIPLTLFGTTWYFPVQGFSVLSLPLIWLYNGEKGRGGRILQLGSYLFYPLHMVMLYLLSLLL